MPNMREIDPMQSMSYLIKVTGKRKKLRNKIEIIFASRFTLHIFFWTKFTLHMKRFVEPVVPKKRFVEGIDKFQDWALLMGLKGLQSPIIQPFLSSRRRRWFIFFFL